MEEKSGASASQRYPSYEQAAVLEVNDGDTIAIPMRRGNVSESLRARPGERLAYCSNDAPVLGKESDIAVEPGSNLSKRGLLNSGG